MTTKEILKMIEGNGTKINKEKLLDAIKRCTDRDISFSKDATSEYAVVKIKL